ncbi:hypothetical protein [Sedimentitalea sp.]|uniref:hypothetical protein n=1 Tax=Sedimentitalea sp. TaxID=2048915 RepID=UPI003296B7CC
MQQSPVDRFPDSSQAHDLFAAGVQSVKAGDLSAALESLIASSEALAKVKSDRRAQAAQNAVPDGIVKQMASQMETVIAAHRARRLRSIAGLDALILALASEDDAVLLEIATRIDSLRRDLPDALEQGLARIHTALLAGDSTTVQQEKKVAQGLVAEAAKFLNAHQKPLKLCEVNPFGVKLSVLAPLSEALQAAQKSLAKL